jgi:predicted metal-binding membrane protein
MAGQAHRAARNRSALLVLLGCAAIAWYFTVLGTGEMPPGPGTMGLDLAGFLLVWSLMMAAMMLPALAPLATAYLRSLRAVPEVPLRAARTAALVAGYLVSWAVFGAGAFVPALLAAELATAAPEAAAWTGAGVVAGAGVYQLTPLKDFCLRHCRSPIAFLLHVAGFKGPLRDLRVGIYHGVYCIGCCWGLMVVLTAVGLTNLAWMAAIAATVLLEKTWGHGRGLSRTVGVALIVFAFFVPANPALLPGLHAPAQMQAAASVAREA